MFTAGDGQATLTWTASANASSYRVYYSSEGTVAPGDQSYVDGVSGSPYVLKPLTNGVTYYVVVTAVNAAGESAGTNLASGMPQNASPWALRWSRPVSSANTAGINDPIEFAFTQDMDASTLTSTNVTLTGPNGAVSGVVNVAGRIGNFTPNAPLAPASAYTLSLSTAVTNALGVARSQALTIPFTTRPAAPTNVSATPGNAAITVTFTPAAGATSTRMYVQNATNGTTLVLACETPGASCTARNLTNTYDYDVTLRSVIGGIESDPTDVQVVTPNSVQYAAAPAVRAHPGNGSVYLEWADVYTVTGYHVLRGTVSGGPYTEIASNIAAAHYNDTAVTNGTTYYYVVQSDVSGNIGANSAEVKAEPLSTLLAAPAVTGSVGNGWANLTWPAISGATGYVVFSATNETAQPTAVSYSSATTYYAPNLYNGSPVYYMVAAYDASGNEGARSAEFLAQPVSTGAVYPTAPNVRVTSVQTQHALVEFTPVDGATSYLISRATSATGPFTSFNPVSSSPFDDTVPTAGATYYYKVQPQTGSVSGVESAVVGVTTLGTATVTAPTNVVATPADQVVNLTWDLVTGASSYDVYYGTSSGTYGSYGGYTGPTDNALNIYGLQDGQTYYFQVTAHFAAQNLSASAAEVSATPSANGLAAPSISQTALGDGTTYLGWSNVSGASNYKVYRRTRQSGWSLLTTTSQHGYRDTGLTNGFDETYAVQATNTNGGSAWVETTLTPNGVAAPTTFAAAPGNGCVTFTWDPVPNATYYYIYLATTPNGPYTTASAYDYTVDPRYTDCSLSNAVSYHAVVQAYVTGKYSGFSSEITTTPNTSKLSQPSVSVTPAGDQDANLSWAAVTGATSYKIYRRLGDGPSVRVGTTSNVYFHDTGVINHQAYTYTVQPLASTVAAADSYAASSTPDGVPAPTSVVATAGNGCITTTWAPVPGANYYYIYSGPSGGPYQNLTYGYDTEITYCSASNGVPYHLVVAAGTSDGLGSFSAEVSATPSSSLLSQPSPYAQFKGDRELMVTWSDLTGATSYRVYRKTANEFWSQVATTSSPFYSDRGVFNGVTYQYVVQGVGSAGAGPWSGVTQATPAATAAMVDNVQLFGGNGCIGAVWDPVPGASYYYIYYGTTAGDTFNTGSTYTSEPYFQVCSQTGTTEFVRVAADDSSGLGIPTDEASVALNASAPTAAYPYAQVVNPSEVSLTWTSSNPQRLWRRDGTNARYVVVGQTPANAFDETNLTSGTTYGWLLQPISASGDGVFGYENTATPQ